MKLKQTSGFSLLEVLISLLVIAIGLLGLSSLQLFNLKSAYSAGSRAQAVILVDDMFERLRADREVAVSKATGVYAYSANYDSPSSAYSGDSESQKQLKAWKGDIELKLPNGQGKVEVKDNTSIVTVSVRWNDQRGSENVEDKVSENSEDLLEYSVTSRL